MTEELQVLKYYKMLIWGQGPAFKMSFTTHNSYV